MKTRFLLFALTVIFLPVISWADTHTANDATYANVAAAVAAASAGDTVEIPAGQNAKWSSTLTINKALTLQKAAGAATTITWSANPLIKISGIGASTVRISGLSFDMLVNNSSRTAIEVDGPTLAVRIDHCIFNKGNHTVFLSQRVEGVIDNNIFTNSNMGILTDGDYNSSWARPITAGKAGNIFVEDNTFTWNNNSELTGSDPDAQVYIQDGTRVVVRYNTFDTTAYTKGEIYVLNNHGNQEYYTGGNDFRGQPIFEFYNNNIVFYASGNILGIRGGSCIIYNNTITTIGGAGAVIQLVEEESYNTGFFSPLRTSWPAQDQINNTFIWNNTYNGSAITDVTFGEYSTQNKVFIQKNRDYFMHAPCGASDSTDAFGNTCTHGYEYYTGTRNGGSQTAPTTNDTGSMAFSSSGNNAYYPYTPYEYPHPLRTGVDQQQPNAPQNLSIIEKK
jgi:hypothetical protein